MKKYDILHNIHIEKLVFWWKGYTRLDNGKICFITWWAIPGSVVDIRIIKKKWDYIEGQIVQVIKKSLIETWNYDEIPGTPWINIDYFQQLKIKQSQVEEALFHCKKYQDTISLLPIIGMKNIFWYRNKIEFSFWKYISHRENIFQDFNIGFHKRWDFSRVLDIDTCLLIDDEQNEIYASIRNYTQKSWLPVHDQKVWTWFWRHLMMRKMYYSQEILLVFSIHPHYFESSLQKDTIISSLQTYITQDLCINYSNIKSVYISHNTSQADILIGDMELVYWKESIQEHICWYTFDIWPKSFFQTNSQWASILYWCVKKCIDFWKDTKKLWTVLDLYAGTGTIWMILSDIAHKIISVEIIEEASNNGKNNAQKNNIDNIEFVHAKVEDFLADYLKKNDYCDVLIIDPPRSWMHPKALCNILKFWAKQIIYVSCNPATLWRDIEYILANSDYMIDTIQAVDMFPHTHHIEVVTSFVMKNN